MISLACGQGSLETPGVHEGQIQCPKHTTARLEGYTIGERHVPEIYKLMNGFRR